MKRMDQKLARIRAGESADLLYHLLVLLAERDTSPAPVIEALRERHRA